MLAAERLGREGVGLPGVRGCGPEDSGGYKCWDGVGEGSAAEGALALIPTIAFGQFVAGFHRVGSHPVEEGESSGRKFRRGFLTTPVPFFMLEMGELFGNRDVDELI